MSATTPPPPPPRIVDLVFGTQPRERRWRGLAALAVALLGHGALGLWARRSERSHEASSAQLHAERAKEVEVELERPPPPPPPPVAKAVEPPRPPPQARPPAPSPRPAERDRPPPPAQAGNVVAMAPAPNAPLDLTGDTFVTGKAESYAGGVTASSGTSTKAVETREVAVGPPPAPDRSSTVALEDPDWSCPWPREADSEQIDEQVAVVRVLVRPDGSAESAAVVKDPGHGFGPAAVACALRTAFAPARDREGRAIRSQSPPIRVRFTR